MCVSRVKRKAQHVDVFLIFPFHVHLCTRVCTSNCVSVNICIYRVKVKETPCPPVAPNGKPSSVEPAKAQPAPNKQVCVHLAAMVHVTVCVSHIQNH